MNDMPLTWFLQWLKEHIARHSSLGLAAMNTEDGQASYKVWLKRLETIPGITYTAATLASERLVIEPASRTKHFATLCTFIVEAIIQQAPAQGLPEHGTREQAESASQNCERCGGCGMTAVFNPYPGENRQPASVGAHCVCAHGRWIRQWYTSRNDQLTLRRVIDLADMLAGRSRWLAEPPGAPAPDEYRDWHP